MVDHECPGTLKPPERNANRRASSGVRTRVRTRSNGMRKNLNGPSPIGMGRVKDCGPTSETYPSSGPDTNSRSGHTQSPDRASSADTSRRGQSGLLRLKGPGRPRRTGRPLLSGDSPQSTDFWSGHETCSPGHESETARRGDFKGEITHLPVRTRNSKVRPRQQETATQQSSMGELTHLPRTPVRTL
jgi:hypothetical protein